MKIVMIEFALSASNAAIFAANTEYWWSLGAAVFCFGLGIYGAMLETAGR